MNTKSLIVNGLSITIFLNYLYQLPKFRGFELEKTPNIALIDSHLPPETGQQIYQTRCAVCHNGAVTEAPRMEALQLLSVNAIIQSLETGVMKNQGAILSKKQKKLVAEYISKIKSKNQTKSFNQGICAQTNDKNRLTRIHTWGMDIQNTRFYNALDLKINAQNVAQLQLKWTFAFPEATRARSQPTIAGNTLFTASQHGVVYAIDVATGCIRWTYQAEDEVRSAMVIGSDKNGQANRLYFSDFRANVYAFDLNKRKLIWKICADAHPLATITGTLTLHQNRLYVPISSTEVISAYNPQYECCTFRGSVLALDTESGSTVWKTYLLNEATAQGHNSAGAKRFAPSGVPVWSSPSIDTKRGVLYIGTGENYSRPATPTSDAIIALDLTTGTIKWIRQCLSEDAWNGGCSNPDPANCPENHGPDYDFGAPPILLQRNGKPDLILAGQKSGKVYALDPDNQGFILWEKQVGRGGIMGGVHWGMTTNGEALFVPINDQSVYERDKHKPSQAGLHALDVSTGQILWSKLEENRCPPDVKWVCAPGLSAAITMIPEVIFAASLDGRLHAYAARDGQKLWEYDTNRNFTAVNGGQAEGGTIDSAGAVVVGNQVFINSGYAKFGEKAGNVLLCFELAK
ncbi:MAG: PQQ-binding-like beta-propeller repeat protein [Microscillaceae bacterium]|nr:PQQ-binding-like beta-propeller repeat protein [Microscillaceae bacterium]